MASASTAVHPGRAIGFITLGASLHEILTHLKAQPQLYPKIDLSYSPSNPVATPIVLYLPKNGFRLRFDGPDQRLRLIEVLDFTKTKLTYKNNDIAKIHDNATAGSSAVPGPNGPTFRHVYNRLLGPTFPGEYVPSISNGTSANGMYILSYPGIAFSFPLLASAWSPNIDFVSLLSSSATSPATSMAIFSGESWPKARLNLFTQAPPNSRSLALAGKGKDVGPDEIELAKVHGEGRIELIRRSSPPLWILLSETTPQDLVTELGPPDAIYRKNDRRLSIHRAHGTSSHVARANGLSLGRDDSTDTDRSSGHSSIDESEEDDDAAASLNVRELASAECFYNYFHHGFDVLVSQPATISSPSPTSPRRQRSGDVDATRAAPLASNHLVATKVIFHANIPGSYPFNRHRRSRWTLEHVPSEQYREPLNSEMSFQDISGRLKEVFKSTYTNEEEERSQQRPMVLNRGWGDSPESSCELLGGWEESVSGKKSVYVEGGKGGVLGEGMLGNTELFGFPGMVFEVLKNGAVSALTVF